MEYNYKNIMSPVGVLHIVSNSKKLTALVFDNSWKEFCKKNAKKQKIELLKKSDEVIQETEKQLKEYFSGQRKDFKIPIHFSGTVFQNQAWKSLQQIPFGKTISYAEQAKKINNPKAVRAVGGANGLNPVCIIVPCHRVIGKNGSLTGFGGGLKIKQQLLNFEANCENMEAL